MLKHFHKIFGIIKDQSLYHLNTKQNKIKCDLKTKTKQIPDIMVALSTQFPSCGLICKPVWGNRIKWVAVWRGSSETELFSLPLCKEKLYVF